MVVIFSCKFYQNRRYINSKTLITSGKGFDKFIINSSTRSDVVKLLGNNFKEIEYMYPYRELEYKSIGVSFIFSKTDTLWSIEFYYPFNGISDKGIILNKSTMKDVEKEFGEIKWVISYPFSHWSAQLPGIEYQVERDISLPWFPLDKERHKNRIISKIQVLNNDHVFKDSTQKSP